MATESILIPNPSRYHDFIEVSSDNEIIVMFSRNTGTNDNTIIYSYDSGSNYTVLDYSSETNTILGTTSFYLSNKLYVFYYTSQTSSGDGITFLKYITLTTDGTITTGITLSNITSLQYITAISVNTTGTGIAVAGYNYGHSSYRMNVAVNSSNLTSLITSGSHTVYYSEDLSNKITTISLSDVNDGSNIYLGLFNFLGSSYVYSFGNITSGKITYTNVTGTGSSSLQKIRISNITPNGDSNAYVAFITYVKNTSGGYTNIRIYELQKSGDYLLQYSQLYSFGDTYHTYLNMNSMRLDGNSSVICADDTGFTFIKDSTIYRYNSLESSTNAFTSCAITSTPSVYACNGTPYIFKMV